MAEISDADIKELVIVNIIGIKNNNANFEVAKNSFVSIAFNLKTNFSKYNKSGVTVYVHDINSKNETLKSAVLTVNEPNEDGQDYVVTIKNNYDEVRYFYLEVVLGTATPASQVSSSYFITGNVKLDNLKIAKGYSNNLDESYLKNLNRLVEQMPYKKAEPVPLGQEKSVERKPDGKEQVNRYG